MPLDKLHRIALGEQSTWVCMIVGGVCVCWRGCISVNFYFYFFCFTPCVTLRIIALTFPTIHYSTLHKAKYTEVAETFYQNHARVCIQGVLYL